MSPKDTIRERVLRGLAANRIPGFHFAGSFLGVSFEDISASGSRIGLEGGPHCIEADGQVSLGAVAMIADIALAVTIRAALDSDRVRLATVSMHLQFTGARMDGPVEGRGAFEGFLAGAASRQGIARVSVDGNGTLLCYGTGAFMALEPPPGVTMHPVVLERHRDEAPLAEKDLTAHEAAILAHADASLERMGPKLSFVEAYWGYEPHRTQTGASCAMKNGAHVGNRVGHAQGGLLVGLAARTAMAALPASWALASATACFVSPGEGDALHASAKIIHHGRDTAVVRTEVTGREGRKVLQVMTTHARRSA
ncbi:MAG TPA: acyl-CoA thioesterase domain-containing protein [Usitatibacter sp.]|nr:acyl-CoA thioesterase domain-containing protein [Usitatibacter sp.]